MDAVPNILYSHTVILKVIWILVFVCSSAISSYLIIESTREFLKYQVTTSYRLISEEQSPFPAISICNINPLNTDFFVQLLNEANLTSLNKDPYVNLVSLEHYHKQSTGRYFSSEEKRTLFDMDGFVISCTFQNKPCNMSDFRYAYFPDLTNCIQFRLRFGWQTSEAERSARKK